MAFAFTFTNDGTNATVAGFSGSPVPSTLTIPDNDGLGHPVIAIVTTDFQNQTGITSVTFPTSLLTIGNEVFVGCTGITGALTFPENLTGIGNEAFNGCTSLNGAVTFPETITSIGNAAFYQCANISGVLTLPDSLTSIGIGAFNGCADLTSVEFPTTFANIGNYMFYGCAGLTSVTFPTNLQAIGSHSFNSCIGLTTLTFPASLENIGDAAFYNCTGLPALTFPASLLNIGVQTFYNCTGLNTTLTFPASLMGIGNEAFTSCTSLETLEFLGSIPTFGTSVFIGTLVSTSTANITAPANQGWSNPLVIATTGGGEESYPVNILGGNICFPASTPVETDQGVVAISEIKPYIHTIRGQPVLAVTRTLIDANKRLVVFEEDALGENCPSQKTTCSPNHKILYNGKMVEAYLIANSFNGKNPAVYRVDYDNQPLYNVVLPEHSTMVVNNMTVETLAPHNPIAKRFMKLFVAAAEERISLLLDDTPTAICA